MTSRSVMDARWMLLALSIHLLVTLGARVAAAPQFSNLRVFKNSRVGAAQSARSNSAQRLSLSQLLQRLEANQLAKNVIAGSSGLPVKESVIKRITMSSGAATLKPAFTRFAALNKTLPTTSKYATEATTVAPTPTTPTTTATTTTTPTTAATTPQPTTTSARVRTTGVKVKNGGLSVPKSQLKHLPNSPIYYIKLPANSYSLVGGSAPKSGALPPHFPRVQLPIDFSSNGKPSAIYLANKSPASATTTAATTSVAPTTAAAATTSVQSTKVQETPVSSTTAKAPVTDSRIIYIKGNFNGKPGNVYWQQANYRPPTYWDFLHSLYPKLRKAQLI